MLHIKSANKVRYFSIFTLLAVLTACGSLPQLNGDSVDRVNKLNTNDNRLDTNGVLIPIDSDNVFAAGYDAVSMVMSVQFENGAIYEYYSVPKQLWTDFLDAEPHPWSKVGYPQLVRGGYVYKRIS
jgi:hypothetical protein